MVTLKFAHYPIWSFFDLLSKNFIKKFSYISVGKNPFGCGCPSKCWGRFIQKEGNGHSNNNAINHNVGEGRKGM